MNYYLVIDSVMAI